MARCDDDSSAAVDESAYESEKAAYVCVSVDDAPDATDDEYAYVAACSYDGGAVSSPVAESGY